MGLHDAGATPVQPFPANGQRERRGRLMALIDCDLTRYDREFLRTAMNRVEKAADVIRDDAKRILKSKVTGMTTIHRKSGDKVVPWTEHGPYPGQPDWTERTKGAMVETIRTRRSYNPEVKNVWVMAGKEKTWWAVQLEYGHGQWRGGKKSFLRPAMKGAESKIAGIFEGGT